MKKWHVCILILTTIFACSATAVSEAATIAVEGDGSWTQQESGFFTIANNGLTADAGQMWGISNGGQNRQGIIYKSYSDAVAGSSLPSTIQQGTYVLETRIGSNGLGGNNWIGIANQTGTNSSFGAVAGFFTTVAANATGTKQNMFNEFIDIPGVGYATSAPDPADDAFATWTFTWEVDAGSSVIGSDPNLGFYVKTGNGGGNGFWDNSELTFTPVPEPSSALLLSTFGFAIFIRSRKS